MKKKKFFILLALLIIGIIITLVVFFLYQQTKSISPREIKDVSIDKPTPTPTPGIFIAVEKPEDEEVVSTRTIAVTGKTSPNARIVILTPTSEEAGIASSNGNFSTDIILDEGENVIEISAIDSTGEIAKVTRTVIYSTEDF